MASTVHTRKADEKLRSVSLIGNVAHQIVGAKLPSNRQVLQVFFYNMRYVQLSAKESAELVIDAAIIFWNQARIPIRQRIRCANKLFQLYDVWKSLQKRDIEKLSAAMKLKHDSFINDLDDLFDIAHRDAITMMNNEEDIAFLQQQRQKGRPGSMIGVDQKLAEREERSKQRKEQEEARQLRRAQTSASMEQTRECLE